MVLVAMYDAEILVVGCGNILFKDDGFGLIVIKELEKYIEENNIKLPKNVKIIDGGTGATYHIFSLPSESWKKIIVVDVVEFDAKPGTVKKFNIDELPKGKYENPHSWPVTDPLHELSKKIDIVVIGCKPKKISAPYVEEGLTPPVKKSVQKAIKMILEEIGVF